MYNFKDITHVHLEVSEICNAACPMCARFKSMGKWISPEVTNEVMDLEKFKQIFTEDFVKQLQFVNFCGVLGDPITAQDLFEQIDYLTTVNPSIGIEISTNGGIRSVEWWDKMGRIMNCETRRVAFGIDGLEDTNHLYRRNVKWNKLIENVHAFINSGGYGIWQFIKFKHNEHQIEEVKSYAASLGFKDIYIKDTNRFHSHESLGVYELGETEPTHFLEPPSDFVVKKGTPKVLDDVEIKCIVKNRKEVYISAKGEVLPCCYLYSNINLFPERYADIATMDYFKTSDTRSVDDIVDGGVFQLIESTWNKPSISAGKIKRCAEVCGTMNQVRTKIEKLGD